MITFAEYLNLDWGDFKENAGRILRDLREDKDFCDVTLVCEDNQQIPCHRVILATSSPLLKAMIKSGQHSHPLLYFWGGEGEDPGQDGGLHLQGPRAGLPVGSH